MSFALCKDLGLIKELVELCTLERVDDRVPDDSETKLCREFDDLFHGVGQRSPTFFAPRTGFI